MAEVQDRELFESRQVFHPGICYLWAPKVEDAEVLEGGHFLYPGIRHPTHPREVEPARFSTCPQSPQSGLCRFAPPESEVLEALKDRKLLHPPFRQTGPTGGRRGEIHEPDQFFQPATRHFRRREIESA